MKKFYIFLFAAIVLLPGCKKDDANEAIDPVDPVNEVSYQLNGVTNSNITGEARFVRNEDDSTIIYISLINASSELHPATIRYNSIAEGGTVAVTLNSCICAESETVVSNLDNGNPINFNQFLDFDGHINIYESEELNDVIIAQVNIGSNSN